MGYTARYVAATGSVLIKEGRQLANKIFYAVTKPQGQ